MINLTIIPIINEKLFNFSEPKLNVRVTVCATL
jgi:hypothetical protein